MCNSVLVAPSQTLDKISSDESLTGKAEEI
jgi:hypothetical protein